MAEDEGKGNISRMLLGAVVALAATVISQWFEARRQEKFEVAQGLRQDQFLTEQTKRQELFQQQSMQARDKFQHNEAQSVAQRTMAELILTSLQAYYPVFTKGTSRSMIELARFGTELSKLQKQPNPSFEDTLAIATRYDAIVSQLIDWLAEVGPLQAALEVLSNRHGPVGEFKVSSNVASLVGRDEPDQRRAVLKQLQEERGKLQQSLLENSRAGAGFIDQVKADLSVSKVLR